GELVVIYGSGLGPANLTQAQPGANGLIPTTLAGTSVVINGLLAPIIYTSATQVVAVVPFEVASGGGSGLGCPGVTSGFSACVVYQGQTSAAFGITVANSAPG